MLHIPSPPTDKVEGYYNSIKVRIDDRLKKSKLAKNIKGYLNEQKIKNIIVEKPQELFDLHNEFMNMYVNIATNSERKKAKIIEQIKLVFDYKGIISESKSTSYELAKITKRNTCTYCNRLYTNIVDYKDPKTKRINNGTRITRPVFDHWYCKKDYPLLALSFYNLIPSCSVCNSSIKGDDEFALKSHIHPFIDNAISDFLFSYKPKNLHENEVVLKVNPQNIKLQKTLHDFKIKEVYDAHSNLELKDLIELNEKYNNNYIDTLFNSTFSNLNMKEPEIYRLIFGIESNENEFYKRPFSKFKKDIILELRGKNKK